MSQGYSDLRFQLQQLKDKLALHRLQKAMVEDTIIFDNPDILRAIPKDPKMTKIYSDIFRSVKAGHSVNCGCWCVEGTPARDIEEIRRHTHYVDKSSLGSGSKGWQLFLCGWPLSGSMATIVWHSPVLSGGKMEKFATCQLCLEARKLGGVAA